MHPFVLVDAEGFVRYHNRIIFCKSAKQQTHFMKANAALAGLG
jgi:hypothetical protein